MTGIVCPNCGRIAPAPGNGQRARYCPDCRVPFSFRRDSGDDPGGRRSGSAAPADRGRAADDDRPPFVARARAVLRRWWLRLGALRPQLRQRMWRWVILAGALMVVANFLFPPWMTTEAVYVTTTQYHRVLTPGPRAFVTAPPLPPEARREMCSVGVDYGRLWTVFLAIVISTGTIAVPAWLWSRATRPDGRGAPAPSPDTPPP